LPTAEKIRGELETFFHCVRRVRSICNKSRYPSEVICYHWLCKHTARVFQSLIAMAYAVGRRNYQNAFSLILKNIVKSSNANFCIRTTARNQISGTFLSNKVRAWNWKYQYQRI